MRRVRSFLRMPVVGPVAVLALLAATVVQVAVPWTVGGVPSADAAVTSGYTPVTPDRVMDTREGLGGPRLTAGTPRALTVAGRAGVPAAGAIAVVLNVTVTEPAGAGFVTVYPSGVTRPNASNLNMVPGQTVPNLVVVGLGSDGAVQLFSSTDAHLVVDVVGWYASGLVPVTPGRLMDTREGLGGIVLGPGQTRVLQVAGREGVPATGALAVALNVTAVEPTAEGFVTVWPSGDRPTASNLNFVPGRNVPNAVLVGLAPDGSIRLFNSAGNTHLVVDVAGWFESGVTPVVPHRLMDTRDGLGGVVLAPGETRNLRVVGRGNVPADGVAAVALNVTATEPTAAPFITVWPAGVDRPTASNLNVVAGQTVPNAVVVGVGTGGEIRLFNSAGSTHLIVDVTGWFPAAAGDTTAPLISNVAVTGLTTTSATITWTTDEPATTQLDHGTTAAYGTTSTSSVLTSSHTRTITGLSPSTTYHYRIRAVDGAGNARTTTDATFTTPAAPVVPPGPLTFGSATGYNTGVHAHGVAVVNVTGTADVDLVVANAGDDTVTVTRGLGGGSFEANPIQTYAVGDQPKAVMVGDLNNDGRLDLVTANQGTDNVSVLLANGSGGFSPSVPYGAAAGAHEPVVADLDGDGDLDIAVVGWGGSTMHVLRNNGVHSGTFTGVATVGVGTTPHSVVAFDADADGDLDLASADRGSSTVSVLRNDGGFSFALAATVSVGAGPHSIRAGDLNGDSRPDLVTANDTADNVSVLIDTGTGIGYSATSYTTGTTPKSVTIADLNADGRLDVITANINGNYPSVVNPDGNAVSVLLGTGTGTLGAPTHLANPGTPFAVVAADVNGDFRLDLVTANWHGNRAAVILRT